MPIGTFCSGDTDFLPVFRPELFDTIHFGADLISAAVEHRAHRARVPVSCSVFCARPGLYPVDQSKFSARVARSVPICRLRMRSPALLRCGLPAQRFSEGHLWCCAHRLATCRPESGDWSLPGNSNHGALLVGEVCHYARPRVIRIRTAQIRRKAGREITGSDSLPDFCRVPR